MGAVDFEEVVACFYCSGGCGSEGVNDFVNSFEGESGGFFKSGVRNS